MNMELIRYIVFLFVVVLYSVLLKNIDIKSQTLQDKAMILFLEEKLGRSVSSVICNRYVKLDVKKKFLYRCF